MKIGVLGGTFNPIHNGHLFLSEYARIKLELDKVLFIPAKIPALKDLSSLVESKHRAKMVSLAIDDNPYLELSSIDLDRNKDTFSIDTFTELKKIYPSDELYMIVGADSFLQFEDWIEINHILQITNVIVAVRNTIDLYDLELTKKKYEDKYNARINILNMPVFDISSTYIRQCISNKISIKYCLPDKVIEYIMNNNLYQ